MDDKENRKYQRFVRVRDFGAAHANDFGANSLARQFFTSLASIVIELGGLASSEASGLGLARQGTATRKQARTELRKALLAINRTARAMADDVSGLDDKFRLLRNNNDRQLLALARAFAIDAAPLSARFIAHELPADFLADLNAHIAALESAISLQSSGVGDHIAARAAIDDAIDRGVDMVRRLDAIVKNKYTNNPAILAEWASVSRTERNPRRSRPATQGAQADTGGSKPA